jgi:hypothetical protein
MAGLLADQIQLALERFAADSFGGSDKDLFSPWLGRSSRRTDVGQIGLLGYVAPTDERLAFVGDQTVEHSAAFVSLSSNLRKENISSGPQPFGRQFLTEFALGDASKELVRQRHEDASAVTGVVLATASPSVIHVPQNRVSVDNDLMARDPFDVCDKTDAA